MKEFTRIQLKMERFRRTVELDRAGLRNPTDVG